jgi:hypothetical protein
VLRHFAKCLPATSLMEATESPVANCPVDGFQMSNGCFGWHSYCSCDRSFRRRRPTQTSAWPKTPEAPRMPSLDCSLPGIGRGSPPGNLTRAARESVCTCPMRTAAPTNARSHAYTEPAPVRSSLHPCVGRRFELPSALECRPVERPLRSLRRACFVRRPGRHAWPLILPSTLPLHHSRIVLVARHRATRVSPWLHSA